MLAHRGVRYGIILWTAMMPVAVAAQGVTTAAIQGSVTGPRDVPLEAATLEITNLPDGRRWQVETGSEGRYFLENVPVGGPYRIVARAIGYRSQQRSGILLSLGQRHVADFQLDPAVAELPELAVQADADPLVNPGRMGPSQVISDSTLTRAVNFVRQLQSYERRSPQVGVTFQGGISVGSQNSLFNTTQIDGGINNDLYTGLAPEQGALPLTISPEAVKEVQVLAAPFDIRQGGFTGGLFNVVTQSGNNTWQGSTFAYLLDDALVGKDAAGRAIGEFTNWQFGGTLSGPLIRNRAHLFLSADLQEATFRTDEGPFIADTAGGADTTNIGIRYSSALRFQEILANRYGLDPGTLGRSDALNPARDIFAKVSAQVGSSSQLEVSHHLSRGNFDGGVPRGHGFYFLTSATQKHVASIDASRVILHSLIGPGSNELILSYLRFRDECRPRNGYPQIITAADAGVLFAGSDPTCSTASVDQDAFELTDSYTVGIGDHLLTFGTHNELMHFKDPLLFQSAGLWVFGSLDSLEQGRALHYERGLPGPLRPEGPIADFRVRQIGFYMQDQWSPTKRLTLTGGLRLDVPFLPDRATTNVALREGLGIDTGRLPSGNVLWSPRLGFSYDLGAGAGFLRGGLGLFTGRPPYQWVGNAYKGSGGEEAFLSCDDADVPPFDPINQPETCGQGPVAVPRVVLFDRDFRFPQNLKMALGLDHELGWGIVGTIDLLYTRWVHQVYFSDANLREPVGTASGEGGRRLYGVLAADGSAIPARLAPAFGQVVRMSNRSSDNALGVSVQLQKRFDRGIEFNALYGYSHANALVSPVNYPASLNLGNTPLDGTFEDRRLRTSFFGPSHRVWIGGSIDLPLGVRFSMLYAGSTQAPYTYVVQGDANADGIGVDDPTGPNNDIVYVPSAAVPGGDISLVVVADDGTVTPAPASDYATLDMFIEGDPCLRRQRGRIMELNSCRNGWSQIMQLRLTKRIATLRGQALELTMEGINLFHEGEYRPRGFNPLSSGGPQIPMLRLVGYDAQAGRGHYQLALPQRDVLVLGGRWDLKLGVRYTF